MKKTYEVFAFNTLTGRFEKTAVSKEVYLAYRRTAWNIRANNKSFYAHEIQFSVLIGGDDGAYENFREFIDTENAPDTVALKEARKTLGYKALDVLTETMRRRFVMRYEYGYSLKQIAEAECVSVDSVKESIEKAHARLKIFLKNFQKPTP